MDYKEAFFLCNPSRKKLKEVSLKGRNFLIFRGETSRTGGPEDKQKVWWKQLPTSASVCQPANKEDIENGESSGACKGINYRDQTAS